MHFDCSLSAPQMRMCFLEKIVPRRHQTNSSIKSIYMHRSGITTEIERRRLWCLCWILFIVILFSAHVNAGIVKFLIMGDTQYILNTSSQYGDPQMFISNMTQTATDHVTKDAVALLSMGDLIETGRDNDISQSYRFCKEGLDALYAGGIPYVPSYGNNDEKREYNRVFPLREYTSWPSFVDNYVDYRCSAHHFNAGGVDWLVITAQYDPSFGVMAWVEDLIQSHPDKKVIFITHAAYSFGSEQAMLREYGNVVFVLCGHVSSGYELLTGIHGNPIGWIRTCWHDKNKDTYLAVLELDTVTGTSYCYYYSPYFDRYGHGSWSHINVPYEHPWTWTGFDFGGTDGRVDTDWTNGGGDRAWNNASNWTLGVPDSNDKAALRDDMVNGPIIDSDTMASVNSMVVGDGGSTASSIDINDGSLIVGGWFILAYGANDGGTFNIRGGTTSIGSHMHVGSGGIGTMKMTGGTVSVNGEFGLGTHGGVGEVYLDGGIIIADSFTMTVNSWIDITAGTLIVDGDVTSTINIYRSTGWITAYDGAGTLNIDYDSTNPGKTTVTATDLVDWIQIQYDDLEGD